MGFRIFSFCSFSQGIFAHMLLGDKNDQVLEKEKISCQAQGRGAAGYSLSLLGSSCGKGRGITRFGPGQGLDGAPSFLLCSWHWEGKQPAVTVGKICYHCRVLFSAFSYHDQSSAHKSSHCIGALQTADLTKQRTLQHLPRCLGEILGSLSPFTL